ncbi:MAG TPA: helix-turn-helix transcriptional regulator [Thermoanaerobaculia bacterium]|nr:helix-turn-helix transcriptional regulator [Thermoanaerobaculia bacterium]
MMSEEPAERLARQLGAKIREAGFTQGEVSRRLRWGPDYVNQLLRGNLDLRLDHVYAVLDTIGVSPGHFFGSLHGDAASQQQYFLTRLLPELLAEAFEPEGREANEERTAVRRRPTKRLPPTSPVAELAAVRRARAARKNSDGEDPEGRSR